MHVLSCTVHEPDGTTTLDAPLQVLLTSSDGVVLDQTTHAVLGGTRRIEPGATFTAPDLTAPGMVPEGALYRIEPTELGALGGRVWYWDGAADATLDELPTAAFGVTSPAIAVYDDTDLRGRVTGLEENGVGGGGGPVDWTDITDKPTTFPPAAHTHTTDDITGLATAISDAVATGAATTLAQAQAYADALNVDLTALIALAEESDDIQALADAVQALADAPPDVTQAELDAEAAARVAGDTVAISTAAGDATSKANTARADAIAAAAAALAAHIAATDPHGDRAYTNAQIAALVNGAPGILDTLGEIAAQLASDESAVGALTTAVNARLVAASNLSDIPNKSAARGNLGLGTASTHPAGDFATAAQGALADAAVQDDDARPVVRLGVFPDSANSTSEAEYVTASGEPVTVLLDPYNYIQQPNTTKLNALNARGVLPQVVWMPNGAVEGISNPNFQLADILAGTYDAYMTTFLNTLKGLGFPMQLKWGPEMNGNWQAWSEGVNGNTTGQFAQTWRYVHDLATSLGVTNLEWMWSPTSKYLTSTPLAGLYPGDAYVDSIGVHGYNYGVGGPDGLRTMSQIFDATFDEIATIARGKPMWLAETGTVDTSGEKATWIADFFDWVIDRGLAGFVWFNAFDAGVYDWRVNSSPAASAAWAAGMARLRAIAKPTGKAVAQADGPNNWTGRQNFYAADVVGVPVSAHAASHATGSTDPLTPAQIGASPATIPVNWFTAGMTLEIWQAGRQLNYDSASPGTFTIPTNASVAFPIGATIHLFQNNVGTLSVAGAGGVTVLGLDGSLALAGRWAEGWIRQLATDYWVFYGETGSLNLKAPLASPTFTGTVGGVSKGMVGLGSVDNTADTAKPVSTAQQTALNLKADKVETINTVATSGTTQTIPDPATAASISRITLSANCTFTFPTAATGKSLSVVLVQDATGSRTVTWPATVKWPGGTAPTLTTTAARRDTFTFLCTDGTNWDGFTAGLNFA